MRTSPVWQYIFARTLQGGSRSSSEAHLLRNEVNRNLLASLFSDIPVPNWQSSACP